MDKEMFLKEKEELSKKVNFYLLSYRDNLTLTGIMNDLIELTDKSEMQRTIALNILRNYIDKKILISEDGVYKINYVKPETKELEEIDFKYCNHCSDLLRKTLTDDEFNMDEERYFCGATGEEIIKKQGSSLILKPSFCKKR